MTRDDYAAEQRREAQHRYYIVHREQIREKAKEYREANKEKRRAYMRDYMRGYRSGLLRRKMPKDEEE